MPRLMLLLLIRLLLATVTGILLLLLHYCCCHSSTTAAATRPPESDPQYRGWVSSRHEQTNGKRRPVTTHGFGARKHRRPLDSRYRRKFLIPIQRVHVRITGIDLHSESEPILRKEYDTMVHGKGRYPKPEMFPHRVAKYTFTYTWCIDT